MSAYPTPNVHRRNRRKLGRGQSNAGNDAAVTITSTGTTNATLTFSQPVVVRGNLSNTVASRTLVSQTQTSPTVVTQVWSGNVTGLAYNVPAGMPNVSTVRGGQNSGSSGTFP
jgi:hypothetical protein